MRALLLALALWCPALAWAAGVTAVVDRTSVAVGERITLTVNVEGGTRTRPELPDLPDFDVYDAGTSTQVSFVNGQQSMSIGSTFVLVPKRAGTFTIDGATAQIGGKTYRADPITVTVGAGPARGEQPSGVASNDLFVVASVSDDTPYVGQQVIYTLKLYRAVPLSGASLDLDGFDDFVVEDLGDQKDYESTYNGRRYQVTEIRKALFPQRPGDLTLPTAAVHADVVVQDRRRSRFGNPMFDDFFGRGRTERKTVRAKEIALTVSKPPSAPAGYAGLIGDFQLAGSLSRESLAVGESTTLTLTVTGTGNALLLPEPAMGDLSAFKVYDDKPEGKVERTFNGLKGTRTFTRALVPLSPGELTVPAAKLVVLDPETGAFRTRTVGPFTLHVAPGEGGEDLRLTEGLGASGKMAVKVIGDDILDLARDVGAVHDPAPPPAVFAAGLGAPPLIALGAAGLVWRRRRYEADGGLLRRERALRTARDAIGAIRSATDAREAVAAAARALRGYIGDKLGVEGGALTAEEAGARLTAAGVADDLVADVVARLRHAEAVQYSAPGHVDAAGLADEIAALVAALDKALKGAR